MESTITDPPTRIEDAGNMAPIEITAVLNYGDSNLPPEDNRLRIKDKSPPAPKVSFIRRFHCTSNQKNVLQSSLLPMIVASEDCHIQNKKNVGNRFSQCEQVMNLVQKLSPRYITLHVYMYVHGIYCSVYKAWMFSSLC